jgi:hypothetical protein
MRRYATSRKVAASKPDDVIEFLQFTTSFKWRCDPGVYSASKRSEYQNQKIDVLGE